MAKVSQAKKAAVEVEQLRAENARLLTEVEQLQAELAQLKAKKPAAKTAG